MAFPNGIFKTVSLAAIASGALLLSEPAFAFGGHGGFGGGGFRGGGFGGGGWHGGGWHGGGWGRPGWGGGGWRGGGWGWGAPVVVAPGFGWGWGNGWGWGGGWDNGWNDGYYYGAPRPVYSQCFFRRVHVRTQWGWRWRRVRYCYQ